MFVKLSSVIGSVALLANLVAGGKVAQVVDASNFCVFLPPADSVDRLISDTEWDGDAFCLGSTPKATGAGTMPTDFIQSAHFVATDDYVQVTGQINPIKANLNASDEGGQFDIRAPVGSTCAGWTYYVNLIEPINLTYCMRCCNDTTNCNRGISEKGCAHIIPGDYSGPMDTSGVGADTGDTPAPTSDATTPISTTPIDGATTPTTTIPEATTPTISSVPPTEASPTQEPASAAPTTTVQVSSSSDISKPSPIAGSASHSSASEPLSQETDSAQSIPSGANMLQPISLAVVLVVAALVAV
ncbi:hypothetical protein CLU79DRAFT_726540 [Phycomyces nitens]|nr:hypothetical protein CLU79DRAFT_726540 [Phycomyces nitens]